MEKTSDFVASRWWKIPNVCIRKNNFSDEGFPCWKMFIQGSFSE